MQLLRVGGQRACTRRQSICGVVCANGRNEAQEQSELTAKGIIEFSHWKAVDICSRSASPLQFILDDLASPSRQPACAFRRAVCVPFQPAAAAASVRAGLERQVQLLLFDSRAHWGCSDVQEMAALVTRQGLRASVMHPTTSQASLFARSISAPFLVVTSGDTNEVVVVDGALRDHLLVAPCTPTYQRALTASIPDLFIGTLSRLQQLVTSMASAISLNFASQGVDTPPWRRTTALLSRWAVINVRQAAELAAMEMALAPPALPQRQGAQLHPTTIVKPSGLQLPFEEPGDPQDAAGAVADVPLPKRLPAAIDAEVVSRTIAATADARVCRFGPGSPEGAKASQEAGPEGQVHGGIEAVRHRPFVVVRGFEVGGKYMPTRAARHREVSQNMKPGGLASLCRKQSDGAPGSSTESEGAWGASPASVFRSG